MYRVQVGGDGGGGWVGEWMEVMDGGVVVEVTTLLLAAFTEPFHTDGGGGGGGGGVDAFVCEENPPTRPTG